MRNNVWQNYVVAGVLSMMLAFSSAQAGDALDPQALKGSNAVRAAQQELKQQGQPYVVVAIEAQRLYLMQDGRLLKAYPVSTSAFGPGAQEGSNQGRARRKAATKPRSVCTKSNRKLATASQRA